MMDKNGYVVVLGIGFLIGFLICLIGISSNNLITTHGVYNSPDSEDEIIQRCSGFNLEDTTECLVKNVRSIYRYKDTDDGISLNFKDLVEKGGDCKDWTYFYMRMFDEFDFKLQTINLDNSNSNGHIFLVVNDKDYYCIIDQTEYWCQELIF